MGAKESSQTLKVSEGDNLYPAVRDYHVVLGPSMVLIFIIGLQELRDRGGECEH